MKGCSTRSVVGWTVNRLHYTADPDKDPSTERGAKWLEEAQRGVRVRDWRQEYEIDYRARSGQPVFPEYNDGIHLVRPFIPAPGCFTSYLGCDPHPRTAHAFVWVLADRGKELIIPWSWWPQEENDQLESVGKARLTVEDYAARLKASYDSPLTPEPYRAVMDVAGKAFDAEEGVDYFQKYANHGIYFINGKKNRDLAGFDSISEVLKPRKFDDGERPTLTIFEGCGDNNILAQQLRDLRFREWRGVNPDKDPPKEPEDKNRHLVEAFMYVLLDNPELVPVGPRRNYPVQYPRIGW